MDIDVESAPYRLRESYLPHQQDSFHFVGEGGVSKVPQRLITTAQSLAALLKEAAPGGHKTVVTRPVITISAAVFLPDLSTLRLPSV